MARYQSCVLIVTCNQLKRTGEKEKKNKNKTSPENAEQSSSNGISEDLYEVKSSDKMGRYLAAKKDITFGTLIFDEEPLVVGPSQESSPLCLGCYKLISDISTCTRCKFCKWPLCSNQCPGFHTVIGHNIEECEILAKCPNPTAQDLLSNKCYDPIVPLRCLLLKNKFPEKWKELQAMESHNEIRKKILQVWQNNKKFVVDKIRKDWQLEEFTEEEIHTVCGYLEVNAFEVGQNNISIRALYNKIYLLAHDCVPNTNHIDNEEYRLHVRASTNIRQGGLITLSYAHTLQGTMKRREHLKASKFFDCNCDRCTDPTELQTYMSALKCPKCEGGWVLSSQPLNPVADWLCTNSNCPDVYTVIVENVILLMDRIQNELDSIGINNIEGLESFLKQYERILHPNHYHMIAAKHSLSQLYGKMSGYLIHQLSNALLERKRDICLELLNVFNKIEPGYSRLRGVLMYELHAPVMILLTRKFESKTISKKDLKSELKKVANYLKESSEILSYETEISTEGIMGRAAKEALERIKEWK
ncbi:SET domain-containing protein SmydA-8-like isoform X1 [Lycorma delicatula]|uniref:SET domain-containing protein SmydA-8-like isoform X1 n=1 Tax=Lycorma delicatula TaxID=130591 RepID=UPI003F51AADC